MSDYMTELSQIVGLPYYPRQGPFLDNQLGSNKGAIIGARDGYLMALGLTKLGHATALSLLFRFQAANQTGQIRTAVKARKLKRGIAVTKVDRDVLILRWLYSFRKPKPEEVASTIGSVISALKAGAQPLEGCCEKCGSTAQPVLLLNGAPGYYCDGCQGRFRQQMEVAAADYNNLPADLPRSLMFGILAALLGSLVWGSFVYGVTQNTGFDDLRLWLVAAGAIGWFIGWSVIKGMGKVNKRGQVLAFALSLATIHFGNMVYYTLRILLHRPAGAAARADLAPRILRYILAHFWGVTLTKFGLISTGFALFGSLVALGWSHKKKPKFTATFERLGSPAM